MPNCRDKILGATFERERCGLSWVEAVDHDDPSGLDYKIWLLIERSTGRMLGSIDGPTNEQICYLVAVDGASNRRYMDLNGAREYCLSTAIRILSEEKRDSAQRRHQRRHAL